MPTGNQPLERCDARIGGRTDLLIIVATLLAALGVVSDPAPLRAGVATAGSQSVAGAPRGVARAAVSVHRRMSTSTRSRFEHNMPADADFDPVDTDEEDRDERERVRSRARSERPDPEPGRFAAWKTHPPGWFDHYGECAAAASVTGDSGRRTHGGFREHLDPRRRRIELERETRGRNVVALAQTQRLEFARARNRGANLIVRQRSARRLRRGAARGYDDKHDCGEKVGNRHHAGYRGARRGSGRFDAA